MNTNAATNTNTNNTAEAGAQAIGTRKARNLIQSLETLDRVQTAFRAYARWLRRKARTEHPDGTFDNRGRWYPSANEDSDDFTARTRRPSGRWPYSYMLAARSLDHSENLEHARHYDILDLRRAGLLDALDGATTDQAARELGAGAWGKLTRLAARAKPKKPTPVQPAMPAAAVESVAVEVAANDGSAEAQKGKGEGK